MDVKAVVVIGAGQLGSRHLQALKHVGIPLAIHVVDPSRSSLETASSRFFEDGPCPEIHTVEFHESVAHVPRAVDVAVISTNAGERRQALEQVVQRSRVGTVLFEKFLFQRVEDYSAVHAMLRAKAIRAWVNCPMRLWPFHRTLTEHLRYRPIYYHVTGSFVGLGTSAIHYVDHMAFLLANLNCAVDTSGLDSIVLASKRPGGIEFSGTLRVRFDDGSQGSFTSVPVGRAPVVVSIGNEHARAIIRESEGKAWLACATGGWVWHEVAAPVIRQSVLTTGIVTDILRNGSCGLTPYSDSALLHQALLLPFIRAWESVSGQPQVSCPIS